MPATLSVDRKQICCCPEVFFILSMVLPPCFFGGDQEKLSRIWIYRVQIINEEKGETFSLSKLFLGSGAACTPDQRPAHLSQGPVLEPSMHLEICTHNLRKLCSLNSTGRSSSRICSMPKQHAAVNPLYRSGGKIKRVGLAGREVRTLVWRRRKGKTQGFRVLSFMFWVARTGQTTERHRAF